MAVLDTEVVEIVAHIHKDFSESVRKGAAKALKDIEVPVKVVPDVSKFADDLDKKLRSRAFAAQMKDVAAKVRLKADTTKFASSIDEELKKYKPLQRVRAKVKLEADCEALSKSINDCLDGAGVPATIAKKVREGAAKAKAKVAVEADTEGFQKAVAAEAKTAAEKLRRFYDSLKARPIKVPVEFEVDEGPLERAIRTGDPRIRTTAEKITHQIGKVWREAHKEQDKILAEEDKLRERELDALEQADIDLRKWDVEHMNLIHAWALEENKAREKALDEQEALDLDLRKWHVEHMNLLHKMALDEDKAREKALDEQEALDNDLRRWHADHINLLHKMALDEDKAREKMLDEAEAADLDMRRWEADMWANLQKAALEEDRIREKIHKDQVRAAERRRAELVARLRGFGSAAGGGFGGDGGLVDLGRRGVKPINALIAVALAAAPALIAVASSAVQASTTLVAAGAAALGVASAIGVLVFAFGGLGDALKEYEQAAQGSEAASQKLDARLRAMSPAARTLFGELVEIKAEMKGFARLAQEQVLPGFTAFLRLVRQAPRGGASTVAILNAGMLDLGEVISESTARLGVFASSEFFKGHLASIVGENTAAFKNLSDAALNMLRPITRLVSAAAPQMTRFTQFLEDAAERFARWVDTFTDAQLTEFFRRAGDEAARWGDIVGNLIGTLLGLGRASLGAGNTLVERFRAWTQAVNDFVNGPGLARTTAFFQFFADLPWGQIASGLLAVAAGVAALKAAQIAAGAAQGFMGIIADIVAGNVAALALKAAAVAVVALGAGFAYAYTQSKDFRDGVAAAGARLAELGNTLATIIAPALDAFTGALERNAAEITEMAKAYGELGEKGLTQLVVSIGSVIFIILALGAAVLEVQGFIVKMVFTVMEGWAKLASFMTSVWGAVVSGVLRGAAKMYGAINDLPVLGAFIDDEDVRQLEAAADATDSFFDALKGKFDSLEDYAHNSLERMWADAANAGNIAADARQRYAETLSVYESQVPAAARGGVRGTTLADDIVAAKSALDAARKSQADSASRFADALVGANRAIRDAQIGVREANLGVRDAIQNARDAKQAVADAKQAVADARKAIVDGQREEAEAQRDITQARKEATQALKDLRAEVQGLAVDEREARFNLAVAKEVRKGFEYTSSVDPLFKEELDLDVAQAQQDLNDTINEGTKKRRELADAERKGIERSDQVVQAKKRLQDIQERNLQLQRDLIRAQQDAVRAQEAEVRSQEAVRRAHESVRSANETLNDAVKARTQSSKDAATAASDEAKQVESARKTYEALTKQIKAVPPKNTIRTEIIPSVVLTKEYKDLRGKLTLSVYESQVPKAARQAAGGPIYGGGDGQSDSVPILASKGEWMQPKSAVNYYGTGVMDAMRRRAVPRGLLAGYAAGGKVGDPVGAAMHPAYRTVMAAAIGTQYGKQLAAKQANALGAKMAVPPIITTFIMPAHAVTYAGLDIKGTGTWPLGGPWPASPAHQRGDSGIWQQLLALVKATGIPYSFGNAYRAGDDKWHGSGRAIDFMGYNQDALGAFFMSIKDKVLELIHTTPKGGYYITRGVVQSSMGVQDALHRNHLHVAMDSGGYLPPGTTVVHNRTGKPERVRTAEQEAGLRNVRLDIRDVKLLAAYIAQATERPIEMDGRRVAEAVNAQVYLPLGV